MVTLVPKQGIRLSSCDLFIGHGFLNQFCNCHFTWAAISWYNHSRIYFQVLHCMRSKESREVLRWPFATRIPVALGSCPVDRPAHHALVAIELFEQPILPGEWPGGALIGLTWYMTGSEGDKRHRCGARWKTISECHRCTDTLGLARIQTSNHQPKLRSKGHTSPLALAPPACASPCQP